MPNGYDADDFSQPQGPPGSGPFRIVHTGYLHTELGRGLADGRLTRRLLGGDLSGVNILTRSHVYLLEAIDRLIADDASVAQRLELHLAGVLSDSDIDVAQRSPVVRMPGYLPHAETIGLLRSSDLLFLPMHDLPTGVRARIVPGKTYEYLASGRPILAAVPDGDARDLLTRAGTGLLCRPDDVAGMATIIAGELERVRRGERPPTIETRCPRALRAPRPHRPARTDLRFDRRGPRCVCPADRGDRLIRLLARWVGEPTPPASLQPLGHAHAREHALGRSKRGREQGPRDVDPERPEPAREQDHVGFLPALVPEPPLVIGVAEAVVDRRSTSSSSQSCSITRTRRYLPIP